jgi:predicted amidohydrolase
MKIAALQLAPHRGMPHFNLERIVAIAGDFTGDLLVLPELASTGYFFTSAEELRELAEIPETGPFCSWMRELSERSGAVVVGGFAEKTPAGDLFNSALIALPDGSFRIYRKTHLFYREREVFLPGDTGFFIVEWKGVRIGTMICYDWRFPESSRTLALRGADIIAHPSDLVAKKELWGPTMRTRALENKVIIVTANRCGQDTLDGQTVAFSGESQITGMNGRILAECGPDDELIIITEADPLATRDKSFSPYNDILADRRPEMYVR